MKLIVCKNKEEMSLAAAKELESCVRTKPDCVLGLATGSTPIGMYEILCRMHKEEGLDFSKVTTFNLDEYCNLPIEDKNSYHYFMQENLFSKINVKPENINIPNGLSKDFANEGAAYDSKIDSLGGIDIQILGIGRNGHIGFNEPADALEFGTHVTDLTETTINDNARFFANKDEVPTKAITMGVGSIMKAKKILILANGENKKEAVAAMLSGKISTQVPASLLQLHEDVTIICDEAAYNA